MKTKTKFRIISIAIVAAIILAGIVIYYWHIPYEEHRKAVIQKRKDKINHKIASAGFNFNSTKPKDGEYKPEAWYITYYEVEDDWKDVESALDRMFDFMRSDRLPKDAKLYAYEYLGDISVAYGFETPAGKILIICEIDIEFDC